MLASATPAVAAHSSHGGGGGSASATGLDVSWPQCGSSLPTSTGFAIVGITGGLANDLNPCLAPSLSYPSYTQSELYWAEASAAGTSTQPPVSLYVNTADPGNSYNGTPITDWPTQSISSDPYPPCATVTGSSLGANSDGCAWQYGYDKATQNVQWLTSAAASLSGAKTTNPIPVSASDYPWWLDVETANSWQADTSMNVADLQGMIAGFNAQGVSNVGVYSTSYQWGQITGGTTSSTPGLGAIPDWIPGARSQKAAASNCGLASFTYGKVVLT